MKVSIFTLAVLLLVTGTLIAKPAPGTWVAIVPPGLEESFLPLAKQRENEGWDVRVLKRDALGQSEQLPGAIRALLHALVDDAASPQPVVAVLFGVPLVANDVADGDAVVPSIAGDFLRMDGVAADSMYALRDDGSPVAGLSVGRLPARNAKELDAMIGKLRKFETATGAPRWKTRLSVVAASSGGGMLADAFVGQQMNVRLKNLPPRWTMSQISDLAGSLFRVPVNDLRVQTKTMLEGGQLFSCYLGHSFPAAVTSNGNHFFNRDDFAGLRIDSGAGVFLTCGCETLAHGIPGEDGHGYSAMRSPMGPVAFIGAEDISYAAIGLLAFDGLTKVLADDVRSELTLADCWQSIRSGIETGEINATIFTLMDQNDGTAGKVPLQDQRKEHLQMWMLLGDPAMRIPVINDKVELAGGESTASPGSKLTVRGQLPDGWENATVQLTVERSVDSTPIAKSKGQPNKFVLAETVLLAKTASFEAELPLPEDLPRERILVRALAESDGRSAHGVIEIAVEQTEKELPQ